MRLTKTKLAALGIATLAIAALPTAGVFAANQQNVTINATVSSGITITASVETVNLSPEAGGAAETGNTVLTVKSNNTSGYNLTIKDSDSVTALSTGGADPKLIPASAGRVNNSGTPIVPANLAALADNTWGYRLSTWASDQYAGVTTAGETIVKTDAPTGVDGATHTVTFGVKVTAGQPQGTYSSTVVFAANNNA